MTTSHTFTPDTSGEPGRVIPANKDRFVTSTVKVADRAEVAASDGRCPVCRGLWGKGPSCGSCGQVDGMPYGVRIASLPERFSAYLLDLVVGVLTLGIGWVIWNFILAFGGQTPGKRLLRMKCVKVADHELAGWWAMFWRGAAAGLMFLGIQLAVRAAVERLDTGALLTLEPVSIGIIASWLLYLTPLFDRLNRTLWDRAVGVMVVSDPTHQV
jgi:uncharacterized RDD family membrane protein YckC